MRPSFYKPCYRRPAVYYKSIAPRTARPWQPRRPEITHGLMMEDPTNRLTVEEEDDEDM